MRNEMELKYLKSGCYYSETRIGNYSNFFSLLNYDNIEDKIYKSIIIEDYNAIKEKLQEPKVSRNLLNFYQKEMYLENYKKILHEAEKLFGINLDIPLFLVDKLIEPFNSRDCDGVSIDKVDCLKLNIPSGIYYVKKYMTHVYFEFIVTHELVHQVISEFSQYVPYTSLLEEGFCDLISLIILLKTDLFDLTVLKNLILYNRILQPSSTIWNFYYNSFKIACRYMLVNGLNNTIKLIKSGRNYIKNLDIKDIKLDKVEYKNDSLLSELIGLDAFFSVNITDFYVIKLCKERESAYLTKNFKTNLEHLNEQGLIIFNDNNIYVQDSSFYEYMRYIIDD